MDTETKAVMKEVATEASEETVKKTLMALGIDYRNPIELQKDLATLRVLREMHQDPEFHKDLMHLRKWRKSLDTVQNKGFMMALGFVIIGAVALAVNGVWARFFRLGG